MAWSIQTLGQLFLRAVECNKPEHLLVEQKGGYAALSSAEFYRQVVRLHLALRSLGLWRGERCALLSENRWEWPVADFAMISAGVISVPLDPTLSAEEIHPALARCGARAIFVSTRAQREKVAAIRKRLPSLESIIVLEGGPEGPVSRVFSFSQLIGLSPATEDERRLFQSSVDRLRPDDAVSMSYTPGPTGAPAGAMVLHADLVRRLASNLQACSDDVVLFLLPLWRADARAIAYQCYLRGAAVAHVEAERVQASLERIRPTLLIAEPLCLEKIGGDIVKSVTAESPFRRRLFEWALRVGSEQSLYQGDERSLPLWLRIKYSLANRLVFSSLRARLGGRLLRLASLGGPLDRELSAFFRGLNLPILELCNLTVEVHNSAATELAEKVDVFHAPVSPAVRDHNPRPPVTEQVKGEVSLGDPSSACPAATASSALVAGDRRARWRAPQFVKALREHAPRMRAGLGQPAEWIRKSAAGPLAAAKQLQSIRDSIVRSIASSLQRCRHSALALLEALFLSRFVRASKGFGRRLWLALRPAKLVRAARKDAERLHRALGTLLKRCLERIQQSARRALVVANQLRLSTHGWIVTPGASSLQRMQRLVRDPPAGLRVRGELRAIKGYARRFWLAPGDSAKEILGAAKRFSTEAIDPVSGGPARLDIVGLNFRASVGASDLPPGTASESDSVSQDLWRPLFSVSPSYVVAVSFSALVVIWGLGTWLYHLSESLGVAGFNRPVMSGFYTVGSGFWAGISSAGALTSAFLRLTRAAWGKPLLRVAEALTIFALLIGLGFLVVDSGGSRLLYAPLPWLGPNFRSPLVWDLTAMLAYLIASVILLYLPLIPDLAHLASHTSDWRGSFYRLLSRNWTGSDQEWHALGRAMKLTSGIVVALGAVQVTVAGGFALSVAPMWHSTMLAPCFVAGAILSGVAALLLVSAIIRKAMRLDRYMEPVLFENLAKLLLLMSGVWFGLTVAQHLLVWFGNQPGARHVLGTRIRGPYAVYFWTMLALNLVVPFVLLGVRRLRSAGTAAIAAVAVLAGMWLDWYLLVVPTLAHPYLPAVWGGYSPSGLEISITISGFAAMALLYLIFSKCFPIIGIWEYKYKHVSDR